MMAVRKRARLMPSFAHRSISSYLLEAFCWCVILLLPHPSSDIILPARLLAISPSEHCRPPVDDELDCSREDHSKPLCLYTSHRARARHKNTFHSEPLLVKYFHFHRSHRSVWQGGFSLRFCCPSATPPLKSLKAG